MSDPDIPIFYINLASRPDRRERMEGIFARLGVRGRRIEAFTPETMPEAYRAALRAADSSTRLEDVEMACHASHRAALQAIVDSGERMGVVLEDDVRIAADFVRQVRNLAARADFDIVRLETYEAVFRVAKPATPLTDGYVVYRLADYPGGSAGYAVTREGAERYLAMAIDPAVPNDHWLFNMQNAKPRRLRAGQLVPAVVIQHWIRSPDGPVAIDTDLEHARIKRYARAGITFDAEPASWLVREVRRPFIRLGRAIERFRHGNPVFFRRVKPFVAFADDLDRARTAGAEGPDAAMPKAE